MQAAGRPLTLVHVDASVLRSHGRVQLLPLPEQHARPNTEPAAATVMAGGEAGPGESKGDGGVTYVSVGVAQGDSVVRIVDPKTGVCMVRSNGNSLTGQGTHTYTVTRDSLRRGTCELLACTGVMMCWGCVWQEEGHVGEIWLDGACKVPT